MGSSCQARPDNQFGIDQSRWGQRHRLEIIHFKMSNSPWRNPILHRGIQFSLEESNSPWRNQFLLHVAPRCEECPLLEDEEITDEEMERLVNMDYDQMEEEPPSSPGSSTPSL